MLPEDERSGPRHRNRPDHSTTATIDQRYDIGTSLRRPCRYCHRTRPLVPIGSSRWWDTCARCARGLSNVERRYRIFEPEKGPEGGPFADPWAERIAEVLADAEARCSA